jgi:hypothetical protein
MAWWALRLLHRHSDGQRGVSRLEECMGRSVWFRIASFPAIIARTDPTAPAERNLASAS